MFLLITPPNSVKDEAYILKQIAAFDCCIIHVRKPNYSLEQMTQWLDQFSSKSTQKMVLHQQQQLYADFPIRGIHLKEFDKNGAMSLSKNSKMTFSAAFHNPVDASRQSHYHYSLLSPVFDSISKPNLKGKNFQIRKAIKPIVALGGVSDQNIRTVRELGFHGIAVLGSVWQQKDPIKAFKTIEKTYQKVYG